MRIVPTTPLPVAIIGCGRMGKLHTRVCSQMPQVKVVGVHDANSETAKSVAALYNTTAYEGLSALLRDVKAAIVAVPTGHHAAIATMCLEHNVACLIEKPLAADSTTARRIAELAEAKKVPLQVGHIERFNPAVRAMGTLSIQPRFIEVTRISPLTFRSIDVGVVLDMMIHDIDIVLQLAASPVTKIDAVGVSVLGPGAGEGKASPAEDICNARLTFASGCVANLTASRLALKTERKLRVFSPDAYITLDYQKKYAMAARRSGNLEAIRDAVAKIRSGEVSDLSQLNFTDLVNIEELAIDDVEPLRAQMESFVECVLGNRPPVVSARDGLAAVETAERIVAAIHEQPL
jgi:predicted dehydrogenase